MNNTFFSVLFFGLTVMNGQTALSISDSLLLGQHNIDLNYSHQLQPAAAKAFQAMEKAALKDDIALKVVSSFRNYATQKRIWNRKYKRFVNEGLEPKEAIRKIIEYSTLPGTSRHHWGTEVDLILGDIEVEGDVLLEKHFHDNGPYEKLRVWLEKNAANFGFSIVYTKDTLRPGFRYEPWHYSYSPLSIPYLKRYQENNLLQKIKLDSTLLGYEYLSEQFLKNYYNENILGIHPLLKTPHKVSNSLK